MFALPQLPVGGESLCMPKTIGAAAVDLYLLAGTGTGTGSV